MKFNESNDETEVENKIKNAVGTIVGKTVITDMKIIEENTTYETFVPGGFFPLYSVLLGAVIVIGQNIFSKL